MNDKKRNLLLLALAGILVGLAVWAFWPPAKTIRQGLDIQGGLSVILTAEDTSSTPVTSQAMDRAQLIVQNRVNALGASEATVQKQGNNSILVQIPGLKNADEALAVLGSTGQLEFVDLSSIEDSATLAALASGQKEAKLEPGTYEPFMTGSSIKKASVRAGQNSGKYEVDVELDDEGTKIFAEKTAELAPTKGQIAIVLDGTIQSAPQVNEAITGGKVAITGNFTVDEAKNLQMVLETGALPVSLKFSESRVVGPTLGQESLAQGLFAGFAGLALVAIYLLIFYRGLGTLTVAAMAVFAVLYLGALAALSRMGAFALSLPGIAGIILTIGIAADSSILILERFKEEITMGRSVRAASLTGVSHAVKTSIDADLVSIVSALSLFFIAVGPVKGFGLTLAIGIVCDVVVMVLFKAPLIRLLAPGVIAKHPGFWGISKDAVADKADKRTAHKPKKNSKKDTSSSKKESSKKESSSATKKGKGSKEEGKAKKGGGGRD